MLPTFATLSARPAPAAASGRMNTPATSKVMSKAAKLRRPFSRLSSHAYSGQLEKDRISAQSRAERNGRSTVRQPTARTTSSAITTICSMRCCDSIVADAPGTHSRGVQLYALVHRRVQTIHCPGALV
jgi:hypothetical protein